MLVERLWVAVPEREGNVTCPRLVCQCPCESRVVVSPIWREFLGCAVAGVRMRLAGVAVLAVVLGHDRDYQQRVKQLDGEEFVAEFGLKDSTNASFRAAPGSMNAVPFEANRHQSAIALLVISGPLSMRMNCGCPCMVNYRGATQRVHRRLH